MRVLRAVSAAILAAAMTGVPAGAQPLAQIGGPKEPPPAGFAGNQYVDSAGCVFLRAGLGGQTAWVPRLGRDRKLVCGYEPTFPPGQIDAAATVTAEEPDTAEAEPAPAAETEPAPAAEAEPAQPDAAAEAEATLPAAKPAPAPKAAAAPTKRRVATPARPGPVRLVRSGPVAPAATLCLAAVDGARRYLLSDGRRVTRCAAAAPEEPVGYLNGLGVPGLEVAPGAPSAAEARRALRSDAGAHRVIWQNGAITTSSAAPAAGPGGYVQVGVFAEPANAARAIDRLGALGLPVASSTGRAGGREVKAIMAGPFATATDLRAALAAARQAGYPDAYIRG